jgi:hypothetical protein
VLHHRIFFFQVFNERLMLGKELTIVNQPDPQFTKCVKRFHVVPAYLAGYIAGPAHLALVDDVEETGRIITPAVHNGEGSSQPAACRIALKVVIPYTGTALSESPTLEVIPWNPLAV